MDVPTPTAPQLKRAAHELRAGQREWLRIAESIRIALQPIAPEARATHEAECHVFAEGLELVADWLDRQADRMEVP